jgi:hypothetical protein
MLILAKAEAAFAVYSSCEIPLGLAYGINSTVLQCQKWILILVVGILNSHFHVLCDVLAMIMFSFFLYCLG